MFGLDQFGSESIRVILGSSVHRVNKMVVSSYSVQIILGFESNQVNMVSSQFSFRSVQFQVSGQERFNSFRYRFGSNFGLFGLGHSDWVSFSKFTNTLRIIRLHEFDIYGPHLYSFSVDFLYAPFVYTSCTTSGSSPLEDKLPPLL